MKLANANPYTEKREFELKGWHVLIMLLAFFGVMFAVNGVFLYHAITSFPGEDVKKSYVQGLNYNDTLAVRAQQAELGWRAEAGLKDSTLVFRLQDAQEEPLSNLAVVAEIRHLATENADQVVTLQAQAQGEYLAKGLDLAQGQWLIRFSVYDTEGETLQLNVDKTLIVL